MKKTLIATLALGAATLTSCVYDPYYGAPAGPPPPHHSGPGYGSQAYQDGYRDGQRDRRDGRSYNLRRQYSYAPALRDNYRAGYAAGYRQSGGGYGQQQQQNYYRAGYADAQRDRRNGYSYNPSRHYRGVPQYARAEFNRGYSAGWAGRY
jgi:hypothetical protein